MKAVKNNDRIKENTFLWEAYNSYVGGDADRFEFHLDAHDSRRDMISPASESYDDIVDYEDRQLNILYKNGMGEYLKDMNPNIKPVIVPLNTSAKFKELYRDPSDRYDEYVKTYRSSLDSPERIIEAIEKDEICIPWYRFEFGDGVSLKEMGQEYKKFIGYFVAAINNMDLQKGQEVHISRWKMPYEKVKTTDNTISNIISNSIVYRNEDKEGRKIDIDEVLFALDLHEPYKKQENQNRDERTK
jgi:hypothetical protein